MANISDIAVTSLDVITAYGLDGKFRFIMDELQDATIANAQEKENITGKGGRTLSSIKRNKAVTVSGTNGLLSAGMMEAQTGGRFEHQEKARVSWTDYLVVNGNAAATQYKAVGTAGAEIAELYVRNADGSAGDPLKQAAQVGAKQFTYDPASKALSFNEGEIADGTEIVVVYYRNVAGDVLVNDSDVYSEKLTLFIDATGEDKCGNVYRLQFYIPKADFSGEFEIAMGDSQTVHAFEAESLAGGCGNGAQLWTYTVFGVNAADAI